MREEDLTLILAEMASVFIACEKHVCMDKAHWHTRLQHFEFSYGFAGGKQCSLRSERKIEAPRGFSISKVSLFG